MSQQCKNLPSYVRESVFVSSLGFRPTALKDHVEEVHMACTCPPLVLSAELDTKALNPMKQLRDLKP